MVADLLQDAQRRHDEAERAAQPGLWVVLRAAFRLVALAVLRHTGAGGTLRTPVSDSQRVSCTGCSWAWQCRPVSTPARGGATTAHEHASLPGVTQSSVEQWPVFTSLSHPHMWRCGHSTPPSSGLACSTRSLRPHGGCSRKPTEHKHCLAPFLRSPPGEEHLHGPRSVWAHRLPNSH